MEIKQSVINTFKRIGIDFERYDNVEHNVTVQNQFGFGSVVTTALIARCITWVYETSHQYERGNYSVKVSDFDRIRYFVLEQDREAYMVCLD